MKKVFFALLFSVFQFVAYAQQPEAPAEIAFAGMRLKLSSYVRRALASDMEMIRRNEKYFQLKVEKANIYFPIVEKVFREEGFPEDFKYLALQESSFVPDAVSSSNAVGYWQFKKESAQEVGIQINSEVDERMNIVASSKGAAAYLKKNNNSLNNWVYALLSYNLGLGGVKSYVKDKYKGASEMDIDKDMHWYVIRFLAHKLAFENAVGKNPTPALTLLEYTDGNGKSLSDIARITTIDETLLGEYNKWILGKKIPTDKTYVAILPVKPGDQQKVTALAQTPGGEDKIPTGNTNSKNGSTSAKIKGSRKERPSGLGAGEIALITQVNKIKAIQAREGDNISTLALRTGLTPDAIMRFNDIRSFDPIVPKKYYYLQLKRNNALVRTHIVKGGETLWEISQDYGVRLKAIRKKNGLAKDDKLQAGRVLRMRGRRPKNAQIEIVPVPKTEPQQAVVVPQKEVQVIPVVNYSTIKPTKDDSSIHVISKGETLYAISKMYTVPLDSLKAWNNIPESGIKEGESLYIKRPDDLQTENNLVHVVNPKETIYKIAKEYNVTVQQLKDWNNKQDDALSIGEKLYIRPTP